MTFILEKKKILLINLKKIKTLCFIGLCLVMTVSQNYGQNAENNIPEKDDLTIILEEVCKQEEAEVFERNLRKVISKLGHKNKWEDALKSVASTACFLEMKPWLIKISFNLGHYGIDNGLKQSTVEYMTAVLNIQTFGKFAYLKIGQIFEKMVASGIKPDLVYYVISSGIGEHYTEEAMESLGMAYVNNRINGISHLQSLTLALEDTEKIRKIHYEKELHKKTFEILKLSGEYEDNADYYQNFWQNNNLSKTNAPKKYNLPEEKIDTEKISGFAKKWENTPFMPAGLSKKGIDDAGIIYFFYKDLYKNIKIPYSLFEINAIGENIRFEDRLDGDIVFFKSSTAKGGMLYAGILLDKNHFLHTTAKNGTIISDISDEFYYKRIYKIIRLSD